MALVVTQEGAGVLWNQILGIASIGHPYLHLFGSAHSPAHTDYEAIFHAIELPTAAGYAPILITPPGDIASIAPITPGALMTTVPFVWYFTTAYTVYGYWLSDQTNTYSLLAEELAVVYTWTPGPWSFQLTLPIWLASQPSSGGIPCP